MRLLIRWSRVRISPDPPVLLRLALRGVFICRATRLSELASARKSVALLMTLINHNGSWRTSSLLSAFYTTKYLPKLIALHMINRPLPPLHLLTRYSLLAVDVVAPTLEQDYFLLDQKGLLQMGAHHLT